MRILESLPGHLFLHLKLLYDGCKGVRDDQDHDPNAWDGDEDEDVVDVVDGVDDDEDDDYQ